VVDEARSAGLKSIVVVIPPDASGIKSTLGDAVGYEVQSQPSGSGHALLAARAGLSDADSVLLLYGDLPLLRSETLCKLMRAHDEAEADITLLTCDVAEPDGRGRVVRSPSGTVVAVVEEAEADEDTFAIRDINVGAYCFRGPWLWDNLDSVARSSSGEIYLTDLVSLASAQGVTVESVECTDVEETLGVNNRIQLAAAETVLRRRIRERWMLGGVTMQDPESVYIDAAVVLDEDTLLLPNTFITGSSRVGRDSEIGPNSVVHDSTIGEGCKITASVVESSRIEGGVSIGPFSHIRPGSYLQDGVHIGNFAEIKNSRLGPGTRSGHFSYIGDAELGANVNIGAGTVTCNFDGEKKNQTVIGDDAFIGSDSMLVAPVNIGARSSTGAGSVVTKDVPPDSIAVGAPARVSPKKRRRNEEKK
jgi:bifunctional UDP-N-acetylglucosamine pyrophosphorylase/glucosamine-1-phosphate N-acetyltransferase